MGEICRVSESILIVVAVRLIMKKNIFATLTEKHLNQQQLDRFESIICMINALFFCTRLHPR